MPRRAHGRGFRRGVSRKGAKKRTALRKPEPPSVTKAVLAVLKGGFRAASVRLLETRGGAALPETVP